MECQLIQKAYKTEIDPTPEQRTQCLKSAGVARFAYNWGLGRRIEAWQNGNQRIAINDLKKEFNRRKAEEFPWAGEVSTYVMQSAIADLDRAFKNFFAGLKSGRKVGFPKFKSKSKGIGSFRLYGIIKVSEGYIQLPNIGKVKLKEKGYIPTEGVKIMSATVSERAGRWYVSVQVEEKIEIPERDTTDVVGVDLGIKTLAVCSDGAIYENPRALKSAQRKLARLEREKSRRVKGGKNRQKTVRKIAKAHARVANIRSNAHHQATAKITNEHAVVVLEDLNIKGMQKNRRIAKAISDAGLYEFRRQITYKAAWKGGSAFIVSRWEPSSKTCSECGAVKQQLSLNERIYRCDGCGIHMDRDLNAAINLKHVAHRTGETINACG